MASIIRLLCSAICCAAVATACIGAVIAEEGPAERAQRACPVLQSPDHRLVFEQWAPAGQCDKAVRTRVTDRFLGYTCTEKTGTVACWTFMPGLESGAFDTSKHYRCLDVAIVPSEDGMNVVGLREWAAPQPKQCNFDPNQNIVASELDFTNGQVCIAGLCVTHYRLSVIGRLRLRKLTGQALRELGLMLTEDQADAGTPVQPTFQRSQ